MAAELRRKSASGFAQPLQQQQLSANVDSLNGLQSLPDISQDNLAEGAISGEESLVFSLNGTAFDPDGCLTPKALMLTSRAGGGDGWGGGAGGMEAAGARGNGSNDRGTEREGENGSEGERDIESTAGPQSAAAGSSEEAAAGHVHVFAGQTLLDELGAGAGKYFSKVLYMVSLHSKRTRTLNFENLVAVHVTILQKSSVWLPDIVNILGH